MGLWESFFESTFDFIGDTVKDASNSIFASALRMEAKEKGILYLPDCIKLIKYDYSNNVIAAVEKWQGKQFLIEGKVTDIYFGRIFISYTMSHFSGEVLNVGCEFTEDHNSELAKLRRGFTVSIEGQGVFIFNNHTDILSCSLRNCKILRSSYS